jgi:outer membrane translocation and assembly module TamA
MLGTPADGLITGFIEQGIRSSFNFIRRGTRLEVARRVTPATSVSGRYALDHTRLLDKRYNDAEQPIIDRVFPQVRLSAFSSSVIRSTRDDPLEPTRGTLLTIDGSLAARRIGSDVGFVKTLVKGFRYRQLPQAPRIVFASGATLGLAHGLPRQVPGQSEPVEDLPASERFYAGGDTTVRGFALDRLGIPGETLDNAGFPKGGHALVILNAELRTSVWRSLQAVGFLDVGNVFAKVDDLDLRKLRGGAGFGVRYRSPVGPIRVDLGFKLSRFDFPTGRCLPDGRFDFPTGRCHLGGTPETKPEPLTALHISLGQAF